MSEIVSEPGKTIAADAVVEFLRQKPDFLLQQPDLLARLELQQDDPAVASLSQRQLRILRNQVDELGCQIRDMHQIAAENEHLFQIYADLYTRLPACKNLLSVVEQIRDGLLQLPHLNCVSLLLSRDVFEPGMFEHSFVIGSEPFTLLLHERLRSGCYLGRLNLKEKSQIFGNSAGVGSAALMLLHDKRHPIGVLAVGSPLPDHFNGEMDPMLFRLLGRSIVSILPGLIDE